MRFYRFTNFINEDVSAELINKLSDTNKDIKEDILNMIQKSVNSDDVTLIEKKLYSIIKNPDESTIEGLIQDSDVQDFYRKYRNEIDEILNNDGFFENISEFQRKNNCISLYDVVVKGTLECVKILATTIREELFSNKGNQ
jgi:hypothetical protein